MHSGVSAQQSLSSLFTQPCSSSSIWGPRPQDSPCFWLIQGRDIRKTSTKGSSVFQSAGPARFIPSRGLAGSVGVVTNAGKRIEIAQVISTIRGLWVGCDICVLPVFGFQRICGLWMTSLCVLFIPHFCESNRMCTQRSCEGLEVDFFIGFGIAPIDTIIPIR